MAPSTYLFGEFRLDPARRELWRSDEGVALPPKAFACLVYLVENRDRAVGRDELIDAVWRKTNLADSVLGQAIVDARRALGDSGEEHNYIQTVRGFGYRWAAPDETTELPGESAAIPADRLFRRRLLTTLLVIAVVSVAAIFLRHDSDTADVEKPVLHAGEGRFAILLPVVVDADAEHAWVRLGVMDLIAQRLRAAGQPMVPSDNVISLTQRFTGEPGPNEIDRLISVTGARLVLEARAEATGTRWRVSLHTRTGARPPLTALGEAYDVIEAASVAADRMAQSLGLAPMPTAYAEPGLAALLQRIEAARLVQRYDTAGALIEAADPKLRRHPEIRYQSARIAFYGGRLDAAQEGFETLLETTRTGRDPVLRARALHGLGIVSIRRGEPDRATSYLEEAASLLEQADEADVLDNVLSTLGLRAALGGDFEAATAYLARARWAYESVGDLVGLATVDNNMGILEVTRERLADALPHLERAAGRYAALHDGDGELRTLCTAILAQLALLDAQAAYEGEARLDELLAQMSSENPLFVDLTRAELMIAHGRTDAAEDLLTDVAEASPPGTDVHLLALLALAEGAARNGDLARAGRLAGDIIGLVSPDLAPIRRVRARAELIVVRAALADGDAAAAAETAVALSDWAQRYDTVSSKVYAALARAETALADERVDSADAAFQEALKLADSARLPILLLHAAEAYVSRLLADRSPSVSRPERALVVAGRLAGYADQSYDAALLQLRVYHALGPPAAWRTALARAQSLAGDRQIPPELLVPPRTR